jgi:hypothetical protein
MKWPALVTCHQMESNFGGAKARGDAWSDPVGPRGDDRSIPFRTCSYCGSIHPEDLFNALPATPKIKTVTYWHGQSRDVPTMEIADWKYGYPHKIYIDSLPNPNAENSFLQGYTLRDGVKTDLQYSTEGLAWAKFYTRHLADDGFDEEAFAAFTSALAERCGLLFGVDRGERPALTWRPYTMVLS